MKKFLTCAMALLLTAAAANAGNNLPFISMGIKAGLSTEKMGASFSGLINGDIMSEATTGYHAGVVLRLDIPLIPIYVQPEILYNWSKRANVETLGDVKLNSFNVPVMVGVGFGSSNLIKLRANVGPVFNLTSNVKIADTTVEALGEAFKKPSITWAAGIGIDIINITFDVRYNGQFEKKEVTLLGTTVKANPHSWTFSLGYLF